MTRPSSILLPHGSCACEQEAALKALHNGLSDPAPGSSMCRPGVNIQVLLPCLLLGATSSESELRRAASGCLQLVHNLMGLAPKLASALQELGASVGSAMQLVQADANAMPEMLASALVREEDAGGTPASAAKGAKGRVPKRKSAAARNLQVATSSADAM